jgi:hypothetical protein
LVSIKAMMFICWRCTSSAVIAAQKPPPADLAEPRLDLLGGELGGERLHELLVFRAYGKEKTFIRWSRSARTTLSQYIAMKGRLPPRKRRRAENRNH